ncbi:hypothetical protein HQ545_02300, partial [Candidatus Woesearchaeota archaeon]|nr:hypothetical protein [Candidatus Woesearchaeota archaeon]
VIAQAGKKCQVRESEKTNVETKKTKTKKANVNIKKTNTKTLSKELIIENPFGERVMFEF